MNFNKFLKISVIFLIIFAWLFSGFPRIWQKPPIPPKIQEAQAAATVYDGTTANLTAYETGRMVFKNPRGLGYYYVFYFDSDSYVKYAYSSNGTSWTSGNAASAGTLWGSYYDIDILEDPTNNQLIVYMVRAGSTNVALTLYKRGVIADSGYTITWGAESTLGDPSKGAGSMSVRVDAGGYVWSAFHSVNKNRGKIYISSSAFPGDTPGLTALDYEVTTTVTYPTIVPTGSQAVDLIWQFGTTRLSAAGFTSGPTMGTQYNLTKTLTNFHLSAVRSGSTTYVLYTDSTNLKHNTFVAGTGWGTETTVLTGQTIDSMSLGLDTTSTPDKLLAFYQYGTLGDVYYKISPVDTISWGSQNTIDDDTEDIDYVNASYKDWGADSKIQLVYTTQTSYLLRFHEVSEAAATYEQSAYRWFENLDSTQVGATTTAAQDASTTLSTAGQNFRLRMLLHVTTASSTPGADNLKLQHASTTPGNCKYDLAGYQDVATSTGSIRYLNNTTPVDGALLTATGTDPTHGADTFVNQTYEEANNFTATSTIGISRDGKWDFALDDFSAPADTTYCFRVVKSDNSLIATSTTTKIPEVRTATAANQPPIVSNVNLNAGADITLTENTTKAVTATGTVSDNNGYADITSVSCRTYRSGVTSAEACTLDNNNCYQVTGATSSCSGNDCVATCNYSIYFHAEPTDAGSPWAAQTWVAWIKAIDSQNASNTATNTAQNVDVNILIALDVSATIGYGTLAPGQTIDPLNILALATTTGNAAIDANISGTQMCTDYPGCAGNTIATSSQRYATSSVAWASGIVLSGTAFLLEFVTGKPTTSPSNQAQSTYWGINIPTGTAIGNYTGEDTFTAVAD